MKSDNDMKRKLVINSAKDAEIISVRLSPDKTPIAYENKVRCLMLSGLSREEAEKVALEPMDLELYYEIGAGLMAVDPAAVELISSCGLTEDECRKLQEESESFNDEMIKFIDNMFGRENMISEGSTISENDTICINIKYHKIGEVFNYKVGMSEMTLRVDKCDRCSGCAFENYIYDCVKSGCLGCEREDGESVRYTIVNT